jgi:hypothetical protein
VDDLHPAVLARYDDNEGPYDWFCSADQVVSIRSSDEEITSWPWSMEGPRVVSAVGLDPDKLNFATIVLQGDAVFWNSDGQTLSGINVWTPQAGAKPFIRWVGDPTHVTGSFGTDGVDMAWRYAEDPKPDGTYGKVSLMTSKYTTDPAAVKARRLRSLSQNDMVTLLPVVVGCGYAVTSQPTAVSGADMMLVRLSDGWSWRIPGSDARLHDHALGVTCKEAFFAGMYPTQLSVARVALDSLGPGQAPD